jgi:hypothetical protein
MGHYITLLDLLADETDLRAAMVEDVVFLAERSCARLSLTLMNWIFKG